MKYAWVENNKIRDIAVNPVEQFTAEVAENYSVEVGDEVQNGWELVDNVWTAPSVPAHIDTNTYLYINYPEFGQVGTPVNLIIAVKFADGGPVPIQSTYYVPVIRDSDGKQAAFMVIDFTDGVANASFTVSEPGKYVMLSDKITPKPTSIIVDHPEIIVV
jgi:hypothetical protein